MSVDKEYRNTEEVKKDSSLTEKEKADKINAMRGISGVMKNPLDKQEALVKQQVQKIVPNASFEESEQIARDVLHKEKDKLIKVGEQDFTIEDLSFSIAQSMENINSETSSEEEYSRWINESVAIVKEMNDGFVSEDDMKHREEFIDDLNMRETEIKTCIALYRGSTSSQAKQRLEFLEKKWAKLMELRSLIKSSTKDKADAVREPLITPEEHEKAKIYLRVLRAWENDVEVPDRIKMKLGITQGVVFDYSVSEELLKHRSAPQTREEAIARINALRGRSSILLKDREPSRVRQRFDAERFYMLKKMQNEM